MGRPLREEIFKASEICIVHAVKRCVRRAYLFGKDKLTGQDFSWRQDWLHRRLESLASVFAIDILSFSILSNHMHVILRNRPDIVATWSDQEVALRWLRLHPGRRLDDFLADPTPTQIQMLVNQPGKIAELRSRLSNISWFMKDLTEPIARLANKEDGCKGCFWEKRFSASRIVDEAGALACSAYVDLNLIRAALAESLEHSVYTSAYDRYQAEQGAEVVSTAFDFVAVSTEEAGKAIRSIPVAELRAQCLAKRKNPTGRRVPRDGFLARLTLHQDVLANNPQPHTDGLRASDKGFLSLDLAQYWELLRWTAQQTVAGASKDVPEHLAKCLAKMGIELSMWVDMALDLPKYFGRGSCIGSPAAMAAHASQTGKRWHRCQRQASVCFVDPAAQSSLTSPATAPLPIPI